MKFLKLGLIGVIALFLVTSCEIDPVDPGTGGGGGVTTETGPTLVIADQAGSLSTDSQVEPGSIFTVTLQASRGTLELNSLTIKEDGVNLADFGNRMTVNGDPASTAAILLSGADREGFTWDISIKAQEDRKKVLYSFELADSAGSTAFRDIEIDTEPTGSGTVEPSLAINGNTNVIAPETGALIGFPIEVLKGNGDIISIAVFDDAADPMPIDAARCYLGGTSAADQFTSNPLLLSADDQQGFAKTIYIRAQEDESIRSYTIAISDANDNIDLKDVIINTFPGGISGNPLNLETGVLFNRAGPSGTGGLDLDTGDSTGSASELAEIKDNGIDVGQGLSSNWYQRISGANGTALKQLVPGSGGLLESFEFGSITTDSGLRDIWSSATDFTGVNPNGESWSEMVQVGDMFIAERDGLYYMMLVTEVFVSPTNNDDFYRMDIKF